MKNIFIFLVFTFLIIVNNNSFAESVSSKFLADFAKVIQMNGYKCSSADKGEQIGNSARGIEFMIACDESLYLYLVQLREDSSFCVEQYKNKGTKCEY